MAAFIRSMIKKSVIIFSIIAFVILTSCSKDKEEVPLHGWFDFVVSDLDTASNVIDLAFLNEEMAGESGYVTVQEGHFVNGAGKRIRFFGTNFTFSSCFPDKETAKRLAARLAKMGMNVVRFHHMDMRPSPDGIWDEAMEKPDPGQLDKLDWLIYQLKLHGVYSNLNLHVSRTYPGVDYEIGQFNFGKTIDNFFRPYIEMQKEYARDLLTHRNPYTGKAYTEEPAVAFIEINNENSLLSNWKLLPQLKGNHKAALIKQWKTWVKSNHGGGAVPDLMTTIEKYDGATELQKEMLWGFMVDTEMAYTKEMIGFVKNTLKAHALVTNTQASYSGVAGVLREATYSDFIDVHAYWEHPKFPGKSWSRTDWLIRNSSMVTDKNGGTLKRFAQHRVAGMPLTISEYDHPAPNFYCAEMYPMLNAVAAFQNWDGIYHFTFNGPWDEGRISGFFSSAGHPLKQIFIPIGSVLFRMGAVESGQHVVQLHVPKSVVIDELVEFGDKLRLHGSNMDYIWKKTGAPRALTLMHPTEVVLTGDKVELSQPVAEPDGAWVSETGELSWDNLDSTNAVFTINSQNAKAAVGYIGGRNIRLGDVSIAMDTTPYNWGTIVMASLDGKTITNSSAVLLVAAGRVENSDMKWNEDKTTVGTGWGTTPTRAEGIPAHISLENVGGFKVYVLDQDGNMGEEIIARKKGRSQFFVIGAQHKTLWYLLKRE